MPIQLLNAFSLNMLPDGFSGSVTINPMTIEEVKNDGPFLSAVGHADTAAMLSNLLGITIPTARVTVTLPAGSLAIVAQYKGPRLPEGTTVLPTGSRIDFIKITVQ